MKKAFNLRKKSFGFRLPLKDPPHTSRFYSLLQEPPPIPIQVGQDGMGTHLISRFELSNKETVWVVMHEESMSDVQKAALENHRALVAQRHVNSVNLLSHQQASFELSLMVLAKTKMTPDTIWTFLADFYKKKDQIS